MRSKHVCPWCKRHFLPNPRLGHRQKCCGSPTCKKKQKELCQSCWVAKNKKVYADGQQDWQKTHPDYWKKYRASHPAYVIRNRAQSQIRKAFALSKTGLQKRIDILQLYDIQSDLWDINRFAKENRSLIPILFARNPNMSIGEPHDKKQPHQTIP